MRGHFRSLLAQFGLTPKSKRGLASGDPGEAVDPLDALRGGGELAVPGLRILLLVTKRSQARSNWWGPGD